ncbi:MULTISPECIES: flippase [Marinomonas]|uniref:Flippase n=1 Tax=Marinomonas arctica TaxID=383750 RepID=A0A7H1J437_9GAMM|nr:MULTISPECIES: flippase [Marinomonas]QNT05253.1 flippase [Marinomonas arctica]GGN37366.1 transporter [Marinomonas arctica]
MKLFAVNSENRSFLVNASFLALMQAANTFLPLLTLPFLVRVLGVELFGQLAFVTAFMYYFVVLADYGFNLTATRDISIHRDDGNRINHIYSNVMVIKSLLLIVGFFCSLTCVLLVPSFFEYWPLYLASFVVVVCQALFPVWFFQGMEAMKYVSYLSVSAKVVLTAGVFIFISGPEDYLWVPVLTALGFFLSVLVALYLIHVKYQVSFQWPPLAEIRQSLVEGWFVFLSQMKITLFSSSNIVILGMMVGPVAVGYYVAAEKIMRTLALAQTPITSALFPLIAKKMATDKVAAITKLKKIAYMGSVLYLCLLGSVYFFSDSIITLFYGEEMQASTWVLKVMLIIPLFIFLNNIFGTQILLNTGREKSFFYILLAAAVLSLVLCVTLTYFFSYQGTTIALLVTEIFIVLAFFVLVRKDWWCV